MTSIDLFLIFAGGLAAIAFAVAVGPPIANAIRRWLHPIPYALIIELSDRARRGEPIDRADVSKIMGVMTVADYTSLPAERQGDIQRILDAASRLDPTSEATSSVAVAERSGIVTHRGPTRRVADEQHIESMERPSHGTATPDAPTLDRIAELLGDEFGQAATFHDLGVLFQKREAFDEAERWFRRSLAIRERLGDEVGQATSLQQLGLMAEQRKNLLEALQLFKSASMILSHANRPLDLRAAEDSIARVRAKLRAQEE